MSSLRLPISSDFLTIEQCAALGGVSRSTIARHFAHHPDVVDWAVPGAKKRSLKIPRSAFLTYLETLRNRNRRKRVRKIHAH